MRTCSRCGLSKGVDEFRSQDRRCRDCVAEAHGPKAARVRERARERPRTPAVPKVRSKRSKREVRDANRNHMSRWWAALTDEEKLAHTLKSLYGITVEQYRAILDSQGGVCVGCGQPPVKERLCVDHDHDTGRVRGLLCRNCNAVLGHAKDDPTVLLRLIDYLDRSRQSSHDVLT